MRYSLIVEIDNIQSHPQRFLKGIIINNCNYSRLEKVKKRWETEVEKIKSFLANQNINCAKIDDYYYADDNSINIVYEYIEGKQLTEESWNEAKIIDFLKNILPTLQKLHDNKIVHGNIKPSNFLEQNSNYFLLDFGFVTKISELIFDEEDNIENEPLQGTEGYRAKEVKEGFEAQPYSDIYSLGITIIELLTGKLPQKFKNQDDEIIWEVVKDISPNFRHFLRKMVESDYRDRYENVEEVLKNIENITTDLDNKHPTDDSEKVEENEINDPENNGKSNKIIIVGKNVLSFLRKPIFYYILFGLVILCLYIEYINRDYLVAYRKFKSINAKIISAEKQKIADRDFYQKQLDELNKILPILRENKEERALHRNGYILGQLGRHEEKLLECEEAVSFNPNFYQGFNCIAGANNELGNNARNNNQPKKAKEFFDKAIINFDKVLKFLPRNDKKNIELAYYNKGSVFISLGKEDDVIKMINEIKNINPKSDKIGKLCEQLKKTKCNF